MKAKNMQIFKKKPIDNHFHTSELLRCLGAFDLTLLGIGAIVGAGIFVLTGVVAATQTGPAIILSFIIAGCACAFTALSYAELAATVGGSGSAYGYAYAGFGELVAWIIGWVLLLEYGIGSSVVAIGWSGYFNNALTSIGLHLPEYLTHNLVDGSWINLPAVIIVFLITTLLCLGIKFSKNANNIMVIVKLIAISIFIGVAVFNVNPINWQPFMPFGWTGVMHSVALIFFAYIGFDAVSTANEEAINPQRDLPIGILVSLFICTLLYMLVGMSS